MIKKISLIGAAVAAALCVAPAMALPIASANDGTPGVATLIVAGSSAFQGAFESELNSASSSVCQSGTYTKYTATVTAGAAPGIFAYSCTSVAALFGTAKPTIIYYRTEGGSIYGLTPVVRPATTVLRLALNTTNCTNSSSTAGACAVGASYNPVTDLVASNNGSAVFAQPDLGLSDEEASMFVGANYPSVATSTRLQPGLTGAEVSILNANSTPLVLQSFGIYTHVEPAGTASPGDALLNAIPSLSREAVADIFRGKWADWSQVPKNDGTNTTVTGANSVPIVVCRREAGSGTQVAASVFFHRTNCGGAEEFVSQGGEVNINPGNVKEQTSSGNMRTCLQNNKGAIGFISAEADNAGSSSNHHMIQIDGQGSSIGETGNNLGVVTASGDYGFAFEVVAIKRSGLGGDAGTLASSLISTAGKQSSGPTSPNVTFLPTGANAAIATFPLDTTTNPGKQPVSCFTRSGNSCAELADAC